MPSRNARLLLTIAAGALWLDAAYLLACRMHLVLDYTVADAPVGIDVPLLACAAIGLVVAWPAGRRALRSSDLRDLRPTLWLLASGAIPLLALLRSRGVAVPVTFLEPLGLSLVTGLAAGELAAVKPLHAPRSTLRPPRNFWPILVALTTLAVLAWFAAQGMRAYDHYLLGFADFGDFARRIIDTWEGRGLLQRSPLWPAMFDHFEPGLILLVPLWPLWPDARLFCLIQAACLALPALVIYAIARRLGASPAAAAAWAGAYLALPAIGQLNLSFSYGFHSTSVALPLLLLAAWALLAGRKWLALPLAVVACTFKEEVFVVVAGLALGQAIEATSDMWQRRRDTATRSQTREPSEGDANRSRETSAPRRLLAWLGVSAGFGAAFLLVTRLTGLTGESGIWRFSHLGTTFGEVVLSPVTRPSAFWGEIFQANSLYYLLCLSVPVGLPSVLRGWPILVALAAPCLVLFAWGFNGATSMALQYVTLPLAVVLLAGMWGAVRRIPEEDRGSRMAVGGVSALTASLVASCFLGALPFSRTTIPFTLTAEEAEQLAPYHATLDEAVATVNRPKASVLASGRLAAHLLGVRRLEMVEFALRDPAGLAREAGPGRTWVEAFEWVALDLNELGFHHSLDDLRRCAQAAEAAGYRAVFARGGVLVYRRHEPGEPAGADALALWRPKPGEVFPDTSISALADGLELASIEHRPVFTADGRVRAIRCRFVLRAVRDDPANWHYRYTVRARDGTALADSGPIRPVGGNRPTSFWRAGEAWAENLEVALSSPADARSLEYALTVEPVVEPFH